MKCRFTVVTLPSRFVQQRRTAAMAVLTQVAYETAQEWQAAIPHDWPGQNGFVTGNTARSITVRPLSQSAVSVGTSSISAKALETGAKAHLIKPRRYTHGWKKLMNAGTLNWPESRGGATLPSDPPGWRVRRVAKHPGVRARYYGNTAFERQRPRLFAKLGMAMRSLP